MQSGDARAPNGSLIIGAARERADSVARQQVTMPYGF
jgi:hypothetical protein